MSRDTKRSLWIFLVTMLVFITIRSALALTPITDCVENPTLHILSCTGTILGNILDVNNASINISSTTLNATDVTNGYLRINTTNGSIISTSKSNIIAGGYNGQDHLGANGEGEHGGNASLIYLGNGTLNFEANYSVLNSSGGRSGSSGYEGTAKYGLDSFAGGSSNFSIQNVNNLNIYYTNITTFSGQGGMGGNYSVASGTKRGGRGGASSASIFLIQNVLGTLNINHSRILAYSSNGGIGGAGYGGSTGGEGGSSGKVNFTLTNISGDIYLSNFFIDISTGNGGDGGEPVGGGVSNGGNVSNVSLYIQNNGNLILTNFNISSQTGIIGLRYNTGTDGNPATIRTTITTNKLSLLNSSHLVFKNDSILNIKLNNYFIANQNSSITSEYTTIYPNITFTNGTIKIGFFSGSRLVNKTYLSCPTGVNITYGNDTTVTAPDPMINWTYCLNTSITYVSLSQFTSNAPNVSGIVFTPSPIYKNTSLNASVNYTDENGDLGTIYYNWTVNNIQVFFINVSGVVSGTSNISTLNNTYFKKNDNVTIYIWASDGSLNSTTINSTIQVSNSPPSMSSTSIKPSPIVETQTAYANSTYTDWDNDTGIAYYNWTVNGVWKTSSSISITNGSQFLPLPSLDESFYTWGDTINISFWANDGDLTSLISSASILVNTPPTINKNTTIPVSPHFGDVTTIQANVTDVDNHTIQWVNFTIRRPNGINVFTINNTNGTIPLITLWNSSNFTIDQYGLYNWTLIAYDGYSTTTKSGVFDTEIPQITLNKPSRNYGRNWSIDLNYTMVDNYSIMTCLYYVLNASNSASIKSSTSVTCLNNTNYNVLFNTTYGNLTLYLNVTDAYNNSNSKNSTFLTENDTTNPSVTLTTPTSTYTSLTSIPLTGNMSDTYLNSCNYTVLTSVGGSTGVSATLSNCTNISTTFNLAIYGNYIMYLTGFDDAGNSNTSTSAFSASAPSTSSSSGGGGSFVTPEKKSCDMEIVPKKVYLSATNKLQEVKITNNEDTSYSPDFAFKIVENKKDYSASLSITNVPETIFKNAPQSFGIKLVTDSVEEGENLLILSNPNCKDIAIPIYVNSMEVTSVITELFNPSKSFYENMVDIISSPISKEESINFIPTWGVLIFLIFVMLYFTFNRLKESISQNKKSMFIFVLLINILISSLVILILKATLPYIFEMI